MTLTDLSFQYPSWYIFLCLLLGLAYALVLYYRDRRFREQSVMLNRILGSLRFITVSLLAILLLSPLLKSILTETKKPVVVLAQDVSESVANEWTAEQRSTYQEQVQALEQQLGDRYDLKTYAFGNEVREGIDFNFADKVSNLSDMISSLYDLYSNQNLGAVIMATDGIYNEGSNPIYASNKLNAPIYTIALGDTTPKRDLVLKRVFHNKIAYLGDKFSIQIDVSATNCNGRNSTLFVSKVDGGQTTRLQTIPIPIDRENFFTTKEVILDANQIGVQRYRISLGKVEGEVTTGNNTKDIFVDVLDARQKILLLANSPHPDLTALKQSIGTNKNYEATIAYVNQPPAKLEEFDFVILHQLPARGDGGALISMLKEKKIPRLYITGTQTNYPALNQAQNLVSINIGGLQTNNVEGAVAKDFSLFTIDPEWRQQIPTFPPLTAAFGEFKEATNGQVLLYQRIGKIDTEYPLLVFGEEDNAKIGVLCAEGIWKWRLFDYLQHENHILFDDILGKTIQYLSLKEDKRKFRISVNKNIFDENEPIYLDAELYNQSYELINEPDVSLTITNSEGKNFDFVFNKTGRSYSLNAGIFPVGNYKFRGSVMSGGQPLTYNGQFSVQPIQLELFATTADHGMLRLLSEKYGGEVVYPAQIASLADRIESKGTVKPVVYQTTKTRSVIHLKWLAFLLISLLTAEWVVRRYFGAY